MTVRELIAALQAMPADAVVMTDAGEGAWAEAEEVADAGVDPAEGFRRVSVGPRKRPWEATRG